MKNWRIWFVGALIASCTIAASWTPSQAAATSYAYSCSSDVGTVTGSATIDGTVPATVAPGETFQMTNIKTSGSVTNSVFGLVSGSLPFAVSASLDADHVDPATVTATGATVTKTASTTFSWSDVTLSDATFTADDSEGAAAFAPGQFVGTATLSGTPYPFTCSRTGSEGTFATTNIVAPPALPAVSVSNTSITEGSRWLRVGFVDFRLDHASLLPVTVPFATDGTSDVLSATFVGNLATPGTDFIPTSGLVVFAPGETRKRVPVTLIADRTREPNETFGIYILDATNADVASPSSTITIIDDDAVRRFR